MTEIRIGELAADRAVQTLRYYEELALLTPDAAPAAMASAEMLALETRPNP